MFGGQVGGVREVGKSGGSSKDCDLSKGRNISRRRTAKKFHCKSAKHCIDISHPSLEGSTFGPDAHG